jgi:NADH:ubiquinone oxidoreductase subunit 3 (subunit A)
VPITLYAVGLATVWAGQGRLGGKNPLSIGSHDVSDFLRNYLTVAIFGAFATVLVGAVLGLGALIRPARRSEQKTMTYESGVDPVGDMWSQSNVRYYVFALLFVLFDVEAVFIFPWATRLELYDVFGLIEMGIFIAILALGLVYAWRKGMLRWV